MLLEKALETRQGRREGLDRVRPRRAGLRRRRCTQKFDVALGPELFASMEEAHEREGATTLEKPLIARGRPRQGALRRLVRALPALLGRPEGGRGPRARRSPTSASTCSTCCRSTRSASRTARAATTRSTAGPDDPGSPYAIGGAEGGHFAVHPELGTEQDVRDLCATAHQHGMDVALDIALNASADHPWLTEHPEWFQQRPDGTLKYAENPPKRYQDIYNFNWDTRRLAGAVERLARRLPALGGLRDQVLPGRQPAHEAVPVLGVADQGGPQGRPRRGLPGRGLHAPGGHARAGQARLHAVLHVLHVEELAPRDGRVLQRARLGRGEGVLPAELLPGHAGHPARLPAARRPAGVRHAARAGGHARAQLRHLLRLRALRERAGQRGLGGVPELREVRDPRARPRRPAAADDPAAERDPPREPGAAAPLATSFWLDAQNDQILAYAKHGARQHDHRRHQPRPAQRSRRGW